MNCPRGMIAMTFLLATCSALKAQHVPQGPAISIQGPTVIAFYPPVSKGDEANADANEALSDFQFYAGRIKEPLHKLGIDVQELYVHSFCIRVDHPIVAFLPKSDVGYYFIAPGRKPHIEYGVMTDADLIPVAKRYFGLDVRHN